MLNIKSNLNKSELGLPVPDQINSLGTNKIESSLKYKEVRNNALSANVNNRGMAYIQNKSFFEKDDYRTEKSESSNSKIKSVSIH